MKFKSSARFSFYLFMAFLFHMALSCENETDPDPSIIIEPDQGYTQYGQPFVHVPETHDIVMYEVNLRAFSPTGDMEGVTSHMDSIAALGINVIWLMPIHPIGEVNSVNSPYSIQDHKAVNPEFGSLEDLRYLVEEAHKREIAVIMDWVANHTSWDNVWIKNQSWYTQDEGGNIVHPPGTNWLDVADLNFDNMAMRDSMIDAMKYWILEANVDGFRCDYANGVPFDFWKQAIDTLRSVPERTLIMLAEGDRKDHFQAGFDLAFSWDFYGRIKSVFDGDPASRIFNAHNIEYNGTPVGKHWLRFTTNHDESAWDATPITLFNGSRGALAASVIAIFTGGVPLIYAGQEVGTTNNVPFFSNSTTDWNGNPEMKQSYREILHFYSSNSTAKIGENRQFSHPDVVSFKKFRDDEEIVIMVNVRNRGVVYTLPDELQNTVWDLALTGERIQLETKTSLAPYGFQILK